MKTPQSVLCLVVAALALTGCTERSAAPAPTTTHTTTMTTTTTSTSAATTTTTQTTPTAAADGVGYAVCASRSCEVTVSGPVDIRVGGSVPGTLSITRVGPDGVDISLALDSGGGGDGTLKPGCSAFSFGAGGGGSGSFGGADSDCAQPPASQPGSVTLQLPAMTGGTAILRIVIA